MSRSKSHHDSHVHPRLSNLVLLLGLLLMLLVALFFAMSQMAPTVTNYATNRPIASVQSTQTDTTLPTY